MPTPDYTRGWSAALVAVEREVAAHGFYTAAAVVRGMLAGVPAAEPAPSCRVGGDPPVPGVGWGVTRGDSPMVYPLTAVCAVRDGWWGWADVDGERKSSDSHDVTSLYRPGDPADAPCWRRE